MKSLEEIKAEYSVETDFYAFICNIAGDFDHEGHFEHFADLELIDGNKKMKMYAYLNNTFDHTGDAFIVFPEIKKSIHVKSFDQFIIRLIDLDFKIKYTWNDWFYSDDLLTKEQRAMNCLRWNFEE